ncbi:MAG TPA: hypothetical protein VML53_05575 [Thermoplasmata archaeon]|nr:hypothetical protein [Thermoplasmata archaeon]
MSDRDDDPDAPESGDPEPPADEEYARAYAAGYEDGARNALREVVQHAARGHTPQEIRMLAEGRLVRLAEEVESKRKGLLAPPRRTAWGAILRPAPSAPARPWLVPVGSTPPAARITPGQGILVREERPARALELLRAGARIFPRIVLVSLHPPDLPGVRPEGRIDLSPRGPAGPDGGGSRISLSELGGRLKGPTEAPGGALVYFDAAEYYVTEEGAETTLRALNWMVSQARLTRSGLVVSCNLRALDPKDAVRLERQFPSVL